MIPNAKNHRGPHSNTSNAGYFKSTYSNVEPINIYAFPFPGPKTAQKRRKAQKRKFNDLPGNDLRIFDFKRPRFNTDTVPNLGTFNRNKKFRNRKPPTVRPKSPSQEQLLTQIINFAKSNCIFNSSLPLEELCEKMLDSEVVDISYLVKDCPLEKLTGDPFVTRIDNEIKQYVETVTLPECTFKAILNKVIDDLNASVKIAECTNRWNWFGSYLYEMVGQDSDIDFYYECVKDGSVQVDPQLPQKMRKILQKNKNFYKITFIKNARVPLIRAIHKETKKQLDISFSNYLGVRNSLLTKLYLKLNPDLKYLTIYLKQILKKYDTLGTGKITTHILFWLIAFFMQQKNLLPAVIDVRKSATTKYNVVGWDCSLPESYSFPTEPVSLYSLLIQFLAFYRDFDFLNYVICPFLGRAFLLSSFERLQIPAEEYSVYFKQLKNLEQCTFSRSIINLQDPSDLSFNLAKQVEILNLNKFKAICHCLSHLLPHSISDLAKINGLNQFLPNYIDFDGYKPYNLMQYWMFVLHTKHLPRKLNSSYVLETVRKLMELVFGFEKKSIVMTEKLVQVSYSEKKFFKNTVSVIYFEYCLTDNSWKNDFIKKIIRRSGSSKEPVRIYLTCEVSLARNLIRISVQGEVHFIKFMRENSSKLFSWALTEVIPT